MDRSFFGPDLGVEHSSPYCKILIKTWTMTQQESQNMLEHEPCHHGYGKGAKALMIYFCPTLKRMENGENVSPSFIWKTKLTKMWRRTVYGNILALTDSLVLCISA